MSALTAGPPAVEAGRAVTVAVTSAGESPGSSPLDGHGPTLRLCPGVQWVTGPQDSGGDGHQDSALNPGALQESRESWSPCESLHNQPPRGSVVSGGALEKRASGGVMTSQPAERFHRCYPRAPHGRPNAHAHLSAHFCSSERPPALRSVTCSCYSCLWPMALGRSPRGTAHTLPRLQS